MELSSLSIGDIIDDASGSLILLHDSGSSDSTETSEFLSGAV